MTMRKRWQGSAVFAGSAKLGLPTFAAPLILNNIRATGARGAQVSLSIFAFVTVNANESVFFAGYCRNLYHSTGTASRATCMRLLTILES